MNKNIDADRLKAEIEKRQEELSDHNFHSMVEEYDKVLDIITSLQKEQPEGEINLGNEVENFCLEYDARKDAWYNMTPRDQKLLSNPTWLNFATNIASHFYELGLNARKEEALKDLPRWKKWGNGACGNADGHPIALASGVGGIRFVSVLGITGEKYIMLDDLKKLPGFKED